MSSADRNLLKEKFYDFKDEIDINPETKNFVTNIIRLGEITNEDITTYSGYLNAHFKRRTGRHTGR